MTRKHWFFVLALLALMALALAACGGSSSATQAPAQEEAAPAEKATEAPEEKETEEAEEAGGEEDLVKKGEELFNQNPLGSNAGCVTCHSLEPGVQLVGPSLAGIATTAAERVPGMSAEEYIRQSILEPNAYVVEGFPEGLMPAYTDLSPEQVDALVAFLMTLK
ncbi:MAG: cytochrome c [Chloroflexi bacterium]|nr:cytochrome c [Chloroflexota bacterium]